MRFDLGLFCALQDEYRDKPVVPAPRRLDPVSMASASKSRVAGVDSRLGGIAGARVLEVGCGRGYLCRVLRDEYGCDVVGVDIQQYREWEERPDISFYTHDIATLDNES